MRKSLKQKGIQTLGLCHFGKQAMGLAVLWQRVRLSLGPVSRLLTLCLLLSALFSPAQAQLLPSTQQIGNPQVLPKSYQESPSTDKPEDKALPPLGDVGPQPEEAIDTTDNRVNDSASEATASEEVKFRLEELMVSGVTVLQPKVLEDKFNAWIGREVGFSDLLQLASEITQLYKERGYVTSRAILPSQDVEGGTVRIHVVEGKVGEFKLQGNNFVKDKYIKARLHQQQGEVFRLQNLEKDIIALNQNSLMNGVHATLQASNTLESSSDIVLDIKDHSPIHLALSWDNTGRNNMGLYRTSATVTNENLLGFGDTLVGNVSLADGTTSVVGQYQFPLNTHGWTVGGMFAYSQVNVDVEENLRRSINPFTDAHYQQILGISKRYSLNTNFPIWHSEDSRWHVTGDIAANLTDSMVYIDQRKIRHFQVTEHPVVRTLTTGMNFQEQDSSGNTSARGSITHGFELLGGNVSFIKFNTDLTRIQALKWGMMGVLKAQAQIGSGRLPGLEQMQIGGNTGVRGFSEGLLIGDSGYLLSGELRFPLYGFPKGIKDKFQGLLFVDHGAVYINGWDDHPRASGNPGELTSFGVGLRGAINKYLSGRIDLSLITQPSKGQQDVRAHFGLNSNLF